MHERPALCVFCGSSPGVATIYRDAATRLGTVMGEAGLDLVYGGGRVGLMGLVADAALAAGCRVRGVIPSFLQDRELGHPDLDDLEITDSMHERKRLMYEHADAFVSLPGGFGTFDETIEVMTWTQLGLSHKPVILVNVNGFWQPFLDLVRHAVSNGFATPEDARMLTVVETPEQVPAAITRPAFEPANGAKWI